MAQGDEALLRELVAGLAVTQSQQTEINRRLGNIEKKLEDDLVSPERVASIETQLEERKSWLTWIFQTVGSVVVITILSLLGNKIGIPVTN
ncbi:hypothetical protein FJ418_13735 [Mesorhizobium sp. B2-8-3]|nr:hypothetical protein FJ418_13735 [Mesorhizobium sp. B2-8-3]